MKYYFAPMEGITTYIFRNVYNRHFGGIDKYFTPFIASKKMNQREINEILPEHNQNMELVPQILTNRADEFLQITKRIAEYGYSAVNLNLGCPSGTVTARKRGAGFLGVPDELDHFLYEIYDKSPLKISVKTRIGIASVDEWENIIKLYKKYPIEELIVHPRLQKELYKSTPHKNAFKTALNTVNIPLCYNGDITSKCVLDDILSEMPQINCVMIGRGFLKKPDLIYKLKETDSTIFSTKERLKAFHDELFESYAGTMENEMPTLFKMKDIWAYLNESFTDSERYLKKIRKAGSFAEYKLAVNNLFRECALII